MSAVLHGPSALWALRRAAHLGALDRRSPWCYTPLQRGLAWRALLPSWPRGPAPRHLARAGRSRTARV